MIKITLGAAYFPQNESSRSLSNAQIYVGEPDTDPEIVGNQVQVYFLQEDGNYVPIPQPVRTGFGGMPIYNGSTGIITTDNSYSLKVLSSTGVEQYYFPDSLSSATVETPETAFNGKVSISQYDNNLNDAVSGIGILERTLIIDSEVVLLLDCVVPENITLEKTRGGTIVLDGNDLTLNCALSGDMDTQWFDEPVIKGPLAYLTAQMFGAKGDSTGVSTSGTDNTTALNNYAGSLIAEDRFYLAPGKYRTTDTIEIPVSVDILMDGTICADFGNEPAIELTTTFTAVELVFRVAKCTASVWTTDTSVGVKFGSIYSSIITVKSIVGFYIALDFTYPTDEFCAWNNFNIKFINNCKRAVNISLDGTAWWNENTFNQPFVRADTANNTGLDFYYIYSVSNNNNSHNRNILLYPSFELSRCIGLYCSGGTGWTIVRPRNESITTGRSVIYSDVVSGLFDPKIDGVASSLVTTTFTADATDITLATQTPYSAKDFNQVPLFRLSDLTVNTSSNLLTPFVSVNVGTGSASPTFTYNTGLSGGSAALWTKENGGYTVTYSSTLSLVGLLIALNGSSVVSVFPRASAMRARFIFLDASKNMVFNAAGDNVPRGEDFYLPSYTWQSGYGFMAPANITTGEIRVWVNSTTVKYIMFMPVAQSTSFEEIEVFTDNPASTIVYS